MWMAAVQAIGKGNQQKAAYNIQKTQMGVQAKVAEYEGSAAAMKLTADFNKAMASDAVISAAQGRRGGSVDAISDAATTQYNWDMDFAQKATELKMMGIDAAMQSLGRAADTAQSMSYINAGLSAYNSYQSSRENVSLLAPKAEKSAKVVVEKKPKTTTKTTTKTSSKGTK